MAAFAIAGLCYRTPQDAFTAFKNQFPVFDAGSLTYIYSASVSDAGVITYNLYTRPITGNALASRSGTLQLTPCTTPDVPYDYANAGAIWGFFFSFTVGLWLVAKNAGLVLEFIKKA